MKGTKSPDAREISISDTIEPAGYGSYAVNEGEIMRVIDVEGQQVADIVFFDRDYADRFSAAHTKLLNNKKRVSTGDVIYSRECKEMFVIRADTCGTNYVSNSTCSEQKNYARYGVKDTRNCRSNLLNAVKDTALDKTAISTCLATFMNVTNNAYGVKINREPVSTANDYIDLQAMMDTHVFLSNCPSRRNPCNAYTPSELQVIVFEPNEQPPTKVSPSA